jgi:uncharacterized damage-inducible protein DinB
MAHSETTAGLTTAGGVNADDESQTLLAFLRFQRESVLKTVAGLPEEAWQVPVVPSGWTVAGMLWHLAGVEHHWLQDVATGIRGQPAGDADAGDAEEDAYDPEAAFLCDWPSAELVASYREECGRSDDVLAVTPLSAAPTGLAFHEDPEYTPQITSVRWIVLHVIEETAVHSGHLEIARELLDGRIRLSQR